VQVAYDSYKKFAFDIPQQNLAYSEEINNKLAKTPTGVSNINDMGLFGMFLGGDNPLIQLNTKPTFNNG
jgi:hypothetical protein